MPLAIFSFVRKFIGVNHIKVARSTRLVILIKNIYFMGSETLGSICCILSGKSVYPFTLRVTGINTITLAMRYTRTLKMQFAFSQNNVVL